MHVGKPAFARGGGSATHQEDVAPHELAKRAESFFRHAQQKKLA
jgi:hypothetical protein